MSGKFHIDGLEIRKPNMKLKIRGHNVLPSVYTVKYKTQQITKVKWFSSPLTVVFA